jgi:predicted site-specific integrase-resolvase
VHAVNLSAWGEQAGISKYTACRWYHPGTLPVPARRAGRLILVGQVTATAGVDRTAIYARVSSADQRAGLDRQVAEPTVRRDLVPLVAVKRQTRTPRGVPRELHN